jgi:hypothetical protein
MSEAPFARCVSIEQPLKDFAADHMNPARKRPSRRAQDEAPMVEMMV